MLSVYFIGIRSLPGEIKGAVLRSKHPEKPHHVFQFRWSAIHVNRPHALPSMFDFNFVGLGCGILTLSVIFFKLFFSLKTALKLS